MQPDADALLVDVWRGVAVDAALFSPPPEVTR
jgi:hypothetical protein